MITPIQYTDSEGNVHDCYQFLVTEFLAAELIGSDATPESIKAISDDFFSGKHVEHTKMLGLDGREARVERVRREYNQAARNLMDRVNNLPAYTVSLIAEDTYRQLLNSWDTEWHLGTWRKLMKQQNISAESLKGYADWILEHIESNKYTSLPMGEGIHKQNKLFIFSKTHLLETVLNHPNFPQAEMVALCYNSDLLVRATVAQHPKCPAEGRAAVALMDGKVM